MNILIKILSKSVVLSLVLGFGANAMEGQPSQRDHLTNKLGDALDAVITGGNLSAETLKGLETSAQIEAEIDGEKKLFTVTLQKESGLFKFRLLTFSNDFVVHANANRHLDCAKRVFTSKYDYRSKLGQTVVYTLIFNSDVINSYCEMLARDADEDFVVVGESKPAVLVVASQENQLRQLLQTKSEVNTDQQGFGQADRDMLQQNFTVSVDTNKQTQAVLMELAEQRANQEAHAASLEAVNGVLNRQVKEGRERHAQLMLQLEETEKNADTRCESLKSQLTKEFEVTRIQMTEEHETTRRELKEAIANGPVSHAIKNVALAGLSAGWATERYSLPTVPCCPCSAPVANATIAGGTWAVVEFGRYLGSKLSWCCNAQVRKVVCKTACMSAKSCCGCCGKKKSE